MTLNLNEPLIRLRPGQVVTLDDAAGTRIETCHGVIWVTEEGDQSDHIVGPGDVRIVSRGGRTLVQALEPAWVSLH